MKSLLNYINENKITNKVAYKANEIDYSNYNFIVKGVKSKVELIDIHANSVQNCEYRIAVVKFDNKLHLCEFSSGEILTSDKVKNSKQFIKDYFKDSVNSISLMAYGSSNDKPVNSFFELLDKSKSVIRNDFKLSTGNVVNLDGEFGYRDFKFGYFKQGSNYVLVSIVNGGLIGIRESSIQKLEQRTKIFIDEKINELGLEKMNKILN